MITSTWAIRAVSLLILVNAISIHAGNIIYVNATLQPLQLRSEFVNGGHPINVQIQPGEVVSQGSAGYYLNNIYVNIAGQNIRGDQNYLSNLEIEKGLFVISARSGRYNIEGPYQERWGAGTLFLVNATGFSLKYFVDYHTIFCAIDRGDLNHGDTAMLKIAGCLTKELYAYNIAVGGGQPNRLTNVYTGSTGNGTFVFKRRPGSINNEFDVIGPFKQ